MSPILLLCLSAFARDPDEYEDPDEEYPGEEEGEAEEAGPAAPRSGLFTYQGLPDPGAAAALSRFPGFGAGHFYAHQPARGAAFAVTQGIGLILIGQAYAWYAADTDLYIEKNGPAVGGAGLTLFVGSRLLDGLLAPYSAHRTIDAAR